MQEYMKVGIIQFLAYPDTMQGQGPILETVTAVASNPFFNAMEVTHIADDGVRTAVADFLNRAKVEPYFCAQPLTLLSGLDLEDADEEQRKSAI